MNPSTLAKALSRHIGEDLSMDGATQIMREAFPWAGLPALALPEPERCGRLLFSVEKFSEIERELHAMHAVHWQETERYRHGIGLSPDYAAMALEEQFGSMLQFTARDGATLAGNLRVYLRMSRHTGTLFATEDTLFLSEPYRLGRNAMRFVSYAERALADMGVKEIRCSVKTANGAQRFMVGMGYRPVATELTKLLD